MKPTPKPDDLLLQNALNNVVVLTRPGWREAKKPWVREFAALLFEPFLEALSDEAFNTDEAIGMLAALGLQIECQRTGFPKKSPALQYAAELSTAKES